ncbi:MAG: hypothetical protein JO276_02870 [Sphingomonadaceae bacterium]|nr:hypothetical protein [Sphingomonadaceae bacterium]
MLKALLALAVAGSQAAAPPAPTRCITRAEVGDVSLVGVSVAAEVVRNACRSYLPTTAFLVSPAGAEFSARLRAEGQRRLDSALDGVVRLSGDSPNMPRAAVATMIRGMMSEGAGTELSRMADASLCRDANEILEIASTLSPDQMARLVGAFASIADHFARMHPPRPAQAAPPPGSAPSGGAHPAPHPAAFEIPAPPNPPVARLEVTPTTPHAPHPPLTPFLCQQSQ